MHRSVPSSSVFTGREKGAGCTSHTIDPIHGDRVMIVIARTRPPHTANCHHMYNENVQAMSMRVRINITKTLLASSQSTTNGSYIYISITYRKLRIRQDWKISQNIIPTDCCEKKILFYLGTLFAWTGQPAERGLSERSEIQIKMQGPSKLLFSTPSVPRQLSF